MKNATENKKLQIALKLKKIKDLIPSDTELEQLVGVDRITIHRHFKKEKAK